MTVDDDPSGDVETETGSFPTSFVVKNGSNARPAPTADDARTAVGDLDDDVVAIGAVVSRSVPRTVHRVDGVVDEVGPHLVELACIASICGHVGAEVTVTSMPASFAPRITSVLSMPSCDDRSVWSAARSICE